MKFHLQYDSTEIANLAAQYMATPYKGGTGADADREMEEAGSRVLTSSFARSDVNTVYKWKSPRRMDRFKLNSDCEMQQALRLAIDATHAGNVVAAVTALLSLKGVGVKMASAILTALFPDLYTVCDFRASEAMGVDDRNDIAFYVEYLEACRGIARKYGVSLRDLDRANWQWSKNLKAKGKVKRLCCEEML